MHKSELTKQLVSLLGIRAKNNRIARTEILAAFKILAAGEMFKSDLEQGGNFYEARLELEQICHAAKIGCEVKPFDIYQGPYAQLENGDQLWYYMDANEDFESEYEDGSTFKFYYNGKTSGSHDEVLDRDKMIKFLSTLAPKTSKKSTLKKPQTSKKPTPPKLVYKNPDQAKKLGVKEPRKRSTPEQRKHLQLIKSVLAMLVSGQRKKYEQNRT